MPRETPDADMTASSESAFIVEKICTMPMTTAIGSTSEASCGVSTATSFRKANIDWPEPVAKSMRLSTCVTQTTPSTATNDASVMTAIRRKIYRCSVFNTHLSASRFTAHLVQARETARFV
jgi:hypothetical protein